MSVTAKLPASGTVATVESLVAAEHQAM